MKARIVIPLALIGLFSVGSAYAMTGTQAKRLERAAVNGNTEELARLKDMAKSGDAIAQYWLGIYWYAKKDYAKTDYWLEKAANQGNAEAEYNLGNAYKLGQGVPQNSAKAVYWWGKGAQRNAGAENNLGDAYYYGQGVPQNYAKAAYWWEKVADHGFAPAEFNLGTVYAHGQGVPQNYAKAAYWYKKAAVQGYARAECFLGLAYYEGHGVPQDKMTAITWWKKAAAHGGRAAILAQKAINMAESG